MGWTYGWGSRKELIKYLTTDVVNEDFSMKVIAHCCSGNNLWMVCERTTKGTTSRLIVLYMMECDKGEWGYKDLDEASGPYELSCPLSYLDLAPCKDPIWREDVREYWARKRSTQNFAASLKAGDKFKWFSDDEITFVERIKGGYVIGSSRKGLFKYRASQIKPIIPVEAKM